MRPAIGNCQRAPPLLLRQRPQLRVATQIVSLSNASKATAVPSRLAVWNTSNSSSGNSLQLTPPSVLSSAGVAVAIIRMGSDGL